MTHHTSTHPHNSHIHATHHTTYIDPPSLQTRVSGSVFSRQAAVWAPPSLQSQVSGAYFLSHMAIFLNTAIFFLLLVVFFFLVVITYFVIVVYNEIKNWSKPVSNSLDQLLLKPVKELQLDHCGLVAPGSVQFKSKKKCGLDWLRFMVAPFWRQKLDQTGPLYTNFSPTSMDWGRRKYY